MTDQKITYENASQRKTYVGYVFDEGEKHRKKQILEELPNEWSVLHKDGHIHIHDLDAYGLTYNCLTFNILNKFPYLEIEKYTDTRKIIKIFEHCKNLVSKVGNEQSGGMGFANFDNDIAEIIMKLDIEMDATNMELLREHIAEFILWCNDSHERMGQVSYYVTLNIGLAKNNWAREVCAAVIDGFYESPKDVIKPNIVFKVKKGINLDEDDVNHYLLEKSLLCSSKKMIPTYLLCDSECNRSIEPELLSIMGCRTRVVNDIFGKVGSIGRGNISNISINLPRLAFETIECAINKTFKEKMDVFRSRWKDVADTVVNILLHRYYELLKMDKMDFPTVSRYDLWIKDFTNTESLEQIFRHGTLSIGFIGLSESMEILSGQKYYNDEEIYSNTIEFVKYMRSYTDGCIDRFNLNFSLLATSGELISGKFNKIDEKIYSHPVLEKGYYTNSFHIDVDSKLSMVDKITKEGVFHGHCNGGCITYVELGEAPLYNIEGLKELIDAGINSGIHYLGFNYPLDICSSCNESGVFDNCPSCGNTSIKRIRRVSGYLEVLDYFVEGKKKEVLNRKTNCSEAGK